MPHYDEAATTASQNVLGGDVVQTSTDAGCESLLLEVRRFDADSDDLESLPTTTLSIVSTASCGVPPFATQLGAFRH